MNMFGGSEPSGPSPVDLAKAEMDDLNEMFTRMNKACFQKCIQKVKEGDLQVGEMTCIDRCVGKFMEARVRVQEQFQKQSEALQAQQESQQQIAAAMGGQ
eukprot:CAMPEP_0118859074 /NCGR_PEP_ID=MMETSP1163-20130328/5476_1 /TAXON_ID=124430 /ORGANISM="Phaeomonas parva, Strain CCMP2877" /LENGTH=99 /DNA_ID=CAMNT_0006792607 /DNA_START=166 /DNA_END=465 /DNA_ORIENTATION=-